MKERLERLKSNTNLEIESLEKEIDFREDSGLDCHGQYGLLKRLNKIKSGYEYLLKILKED